MYELVLHLKKRRPQGLNGEIPHIRRPTFTGSEGEEKIGLLRSE